MRRGTTPTLLRAAIKPGAYFGLVLAAMATANPQ